MVKFHFNTKPQFIKRNRHTILGIYPKEKLARKMTKSHQVLRRPPGLTIDAEAYDANVVGKVDWTIIFDISDGRRFWIAVPEFDRYKRFIDRGQGPQLLIEFKYLHRDNELNDANITNPVNLPDKPETPQLAFNFGGL
ncbi:MAG: hypothetical protein ABSF74_04930 [Dehalococcoidia bacterium]